MKKLLFILILTPSLVKAGGPLYKVKDVIAQQEFDNVYQELTKKAPSDNIYVPTFFQSNSSTTLGTGLILGATVASTVGGNLTTGSTLYWKIYAFSKLGTIGSQSGLLPFIPGGSNKAATISWNAVIGADHYALTRSSAVAPGAAFLVATNISSTSYLDSGIAAPSGNPWPSNPYGPLPSVYIPGGISLSGNMQIVDYDYFTGLPLGYMGWTSAGEFGIKLGIGSNANNFYLLDNTDKTFWRIYKDPNDGASDLSAISNGADNHMKIIAGSSITITVSNINSVVISTLGVSSPSQPAFYYYRTTNITAATGDATLINPSYTSRLYDNNTDVTASTFTAPIKGRYLLIGACSYTAFASDNTYYATRIVTTQGNYQNQYSKSTETTDKDAVTTVIAPMNAGDTAYIQCQVNGHASKNITIQGSQSESYFTGALLN